MANFEAFCRTKKLISNLFFLKSDLVFMLCCVFEKKNNWCNIQFFAPTQLNFGKQIADYVYPWSAPKKMYTDLFSI